MFQYCAQLDAEIASSADTPELDDEAQPGDEDDGVLLVPPHRCDPSSDGADCASVATDLAADALGDPSEISLDVWCDDSGDVVVQGLDTVFDDLDAFLNSDKHFETQSSRCASEQIASLDRVIQPSDADLV